MLAYTHHQSSQGIEVIPSIPAIGSVIWLHGLGADGHDFLPIVSELHLPERLPLRFVFPHAPLRPVTINNGYVMRAWFDIYSMKIEQRIDEKGIQESVQHLEKLIENEEKNGISSENILLAGFSQGSVIAMITGLCFSKPLAGILALSGFLPDSQEIFDKTSPANRSIPIFVGHGTEDTIVPFALGQITINALAKRGYPVSPHSYPMPHSVCAEEVKDISAWMKEVYQA